MEKHGIFFRKMPTNNPIVIISNPTRITYFNSFFSLALHNDLNKP